jgi:hypothetical protein
MRPPGCSYLSDCGHPSQAGLPRVLGCGAHFGVPEILGAKYYWQYWVLGWLCSDLAPGPSMPTYSEENASEFRTGRPVFRHILHHPKVVFQGLPIQ